MDKKSQCRKCKHYTIQTQLVILCLPACPPRFNSDVDRFYQPKPDILEILLELDIGLSLKSISHENEGNI
ncbi:unnamed protein product, partial [Mesorhabditis belari]|uniref:Uncharacterized protein n=1 Tax=Mesorhabditis belari TaxID=2138241 RepID=A0AAF3FGP5_9BILA